MALAREIILKILRDLSLKEHKKGVVVKIIYPGATATPRNYMIVLLNNKSKLSSTNNLRIEFAVNLAGDSSDCIGVSKGSYIVKPSVQDYLELWSMYTRYKKNK